MLAIADRVCMIRILNHHKAQGPGARVAVELSVEAAQNLVNTILAVLAEAGAGGWLEEER